MGSDQFSWNQLGFLCRFSSLVQVSLCLKKALDCCHLNSREQFTYSRNLGKIQFAVLLLVKKEKKNLILLVYCVVGNEMIAVLISPTGKVRISFWCSEERYYVFKEMCFTYDVIIGIVLEKMMYIYLREWMRLKKVWNMKVFVSLA